jgi:hypothetical protein
MILILRRLEVRVSSSSFEMYWRNPTLEAFGKWSVTLSGAGTSIGSITAQPFNDVTRLFT